MSGERVRHIGCDVSRNVLWSNGCLRKISAKQVIMWDFLKKSSGPSRGAKNGLEMRVSMYVTIPFGEVC
jgi:hypothetical protein